MKLRLLLIVMLVFTLCMGVNAAEYTFGYLSPDQANPFWQRVSSGILKEAAKHDIEVIILDGVHDPARQINQAEDLVRQNVDVILISPYETDTGTPIVEMANHANIPIFILDVGSGGDYNALVISDNKGGGRIAGKYLLEKFGTDAKIFEMQGMLGRKLPALRGVGFNEVMDEKGVKIAVCQPADFLRSKGMTVMENILVTNPDLDAVFCWNDEMAMGAIEAVAGAKKSDQIQVIGFDGNQDAIQAVKDGRLRATVAQQPEVFGSEGVKLALKELNGEDYPKEQLISCILITKENADEFLK